MSGIPFDDEDERPAIPSYYAEAAERAEAVADRRVMPPPTKTKSRMQQLIDGDISVDELDDEELQRGKVRSADGRFHAGNSEMVPRKLHDAMMRRILQRGAQRIREDFFNAIDTVSEIMLDSDVDPSIRLRAAGMIIDRIAGKTPEKVEVALEVKPWETVMSRIYKAVPKEQVDDDTDTVDADVVDDG